jgi:amino acid transporter
MSKNGLLNRICEEIEPILIHAAAVGIILMAGLFIALILLVFESIFPDKKEFVSYAKVIDTWFMLVTISYFVAFGGLIILIRGAKKIAGEWRKPNE